VTQSAVRQPIPVGKYFLDRGKISQQQLELALQHRSEFGLKLGQSLVELGFVTEADMVEALRHQARFPCIHLTGGIVDARVAAKLGEVPSRRLRALALNQIAEHTTVALEDPGDPVALEELARVLGTRIFPVYAEPSVILGLVDQTFGVAKGKAAGHKAPPAPTRTPTPSPRTTQAVPRDEHARESIPDTDAAPDDRAVVECLRGFLQQAFEQGASDIHLEARRDELVVRFRVHGGLHEHSRLPGSWARPAIACLKALAHIDGRYDEEHAQREAPVAREGSIPFVFRRQNFEVHIATLPTLHGESAVLHVLGGGRLQRDLEHLGLAPDDLARLETILASRDGLLLVAGPAGSGRTTTLNALLARLATADRKVVALTGRVGSELAGVLYVRAELRAGLEPAARVDALLGQDPDLLVVTDVERGVARSLVDAALAGRGVLAVQHARNALEALTRLVHFGLEPYLLADVLRGVVAQRLVRRICADCKTPTVPDEALLTRLDAPRDGATYFEGEGCDACHGTGFSGRLGLFEVLSVTSGVRRELEKGAGLEALTNAARADGYANLREHGLRQARAGLTTLHEVLAATAGG